MGNRASGHLIEDLQHIKVPIGIELVPCVVAGNGHRDGMAAQLMQQGDPPPPWGALPPLIPILHGLTHTTLEGQWHWFMISCCSSARYCCQAD